MSSRFRKIISLFLSLAMLFANVSIPIAQAADPEVGIMAITEVTVTPEEMQIPKNGIASFHAEVDPDDDSVTYQWFSNTTMSNEDGTLLEGATAAWFGPETSVAGDYYFYVVATEGEDSLTSDVVTLTVFEPPMTEIVADVLEKLGLSELEPIDGNYSYSAKDAEEEFLLDAVNDLEYPYAGYVVVGEADENDIIVITITDDDEEVVTITLNPYVVAETNTTAYDALVASLEDLVEADYTPESWLLYEAAIAVCDLDLDNTSTQAEIDDEVIAIQAALALLVEIVETNTTAYDLLVAEVLALVEADYTPESWLLYEAAIAGCDLDLDNTSSQAEIDDESLLIDAALDLLVPFDLVAYNSAQAEAAALTESHYTAESWKDLTDALAMPSSTQTEIDAKTAAIEAAIDALVPAPAPVVYTITFNANGGTVSPANANTGSDGKLASLPNPSRSSYTFNGWYTEISGGTRITVSTVFSVDTTIYAQWTYSSNYSGSNYSGGSSSSAPAADSPSINVGGESIRILMQNNNSKAVLNISTAQARAMANSENDTIVFTLSSLEGISQVQISKTALKNLADAGKNIRIETSNGSIDLSAEALLDICAQLGTNIVFDILPLSLTNLPAGMSDAQKKAIEDLLAKGYKLLHLSISSSLATLKTFKGNITVVVAYDGTNPHALHVGEDGALTEVDSSYENNHMSLFLTHFSIYAIGETEVKTPDETTPPVIIDPIDDKPIVDPVDEVEDTSIILTINSRIVTRGTTVLEAPPIPAQIINDRTMLPFRYLIQTLLGGTVHWDDATRSITAEVNGVTFFMTIGDNNIVVNGETIVFDQEPVIVDDYTLVPIRVFEQAVQYIGWNEATQTVTIYP